MEGIHRKGRSEKDEGRSRRDKERNEQDLEEASLGRHRECNYKDTPAQGIILANHRPFKALAGIHSISTPGSPATPSIPR